jgi:hypothetical protein
MRRLAALLLPIAVGTALGLAGISPPATLRAEGEEEAPVDYRFYKERISPALMQYCAECHANPRKRSKMGRFFLRPAPGRRIRERYHERNFEMVLDYIEPRNSLLLLKAIGPDRGGVTHEGGALLNDNMAEYGAIVDWINGTKLPPPTFTPPPAEEGQPDFLFFYKRIEPVLLAVCAECHEGRGKGRMKVITHERGEPFPLEDHYANFQMALGLVRPGQPEKSRFLLKPLAEADGGIKHRGGDRILEDGPHYENWRLFINGERGPPLPTEGERPVPQLTAEGLVLQVEDFDLGGDLEDVEMKGADSFYVVMPGVEGGRAYTDLNVLDAGAYVLEFRVAPGSVPLRWGFEGGSAGELPLPAKADADGFATTAPEILLDGPAPLQDARGDLRVDGTTLQMDGQRGEAGWLSPSEARHTGVSAKVTLAHEEEGGDDALLAFDMLDGWNGKFVGLTDGGRRFVIGLIERGTIRVLQSAKAPERDRRERGTPREMKVEYFGGVAVGSLDGKPLVFANLSENLGAGSFGVLTHGRVTVHAVAALEEYEVYSVRFGKGPVVDLPRGLLRLWVEIPPKGGAVDALHLTPSD